MMVDKSPLLRAECTINKSTGRITHLPSNSYYDLLAGEDERAGGGLLFFRQPKPIDLETRDIDPSSPLVRSPTRLGPGRSRLQTSTSPVYPLSGSLLMAVAPVGSVGPLARPGGARRSTIRSKTRDRA